MTVGASSGTVLDGSRVKSPAETKRYTLTVRSQLSNGTYSTVYIGSQVIVGGRVAQYTRYRDTGPVVEWTSATPSALKLEAERIGRRILGAVKSEHQRYLIGKPVVIKLVPANLKITEIPGFTQYAGVRTPDGRTYDNVRGMMSLDGPGVAVGEETILEDALSDMGRVPGYVLTHELGHLVLEYSTHPSIRTSAKEGLRLQLAQEGVFAGGDSYTSSNEHEYWAEGTAAFFSVPMLEWLRSEYTPSFLMSEDRYLYDLLSTVYVRTATYTIV